jgi:hypothetical protein
MRFRNEHGLFTSSEVPNEKTLRSTLVFVEHLRIATKMLRVLCPFSHVPKLTHDEHSAHDALQADDMPDSLGFRQSQKFF